MSEKFNALKKAVFYAQQKPEVLASYLADAISDVVSSVVISGADSIKTPAGGSSVTSTYSATVLSQYGDVMAGQSVSFSLKAAVTGVSVDSSTGVVTVANTVTAEAFTIVATCSGKSAEKTVVLLVPKTITVDGADSIEIPSGDEANTADYTAEVFDQNGDKFTSPTVTYALKSAVTGVSVSGNTVSVGKTATDESFILVATCGGASVEKTVALTTE